MTSLNKGICQSEKKPSKRELSEDSYKNDIFNKENMGEMRKNVLKTPPSAHKSYVRPHTTRTIHKSLFGKNRF